jgi:hypothetical protein
MNGLTISLSLGSQEGTLYLNDIWDHSDNFQTPPTSIYELSYLRESITTSFVRYELSSILYKHMIIKLLKYSPLLMIVCLRKIPMKNVSWILPTILMRILLNIILIN